MDILCFSHLRWDFVYQRPQHLLSRFARQQRVFYIEEPDFGHEADTYMLRKSKDGVSIVVVQLKGNPDDTSVLDRQKTTLTSCLKDQKVVDYILWYYTPMALQVSNHLQPKLIIYDCMDELSAFKFAPPLLKNLEKQLFEKADIVFTGGQSLYEAKQNQHRNIHAFPSSIDKAHFLQARQDQSDPADQADIPHPQFGYYGVIDERFDINLIENVARERPDWHFVLVGPVVKIDPAILPQLPNIHYMGSKSYAELPYYLQGWDIAIIPFKLDDSTRFISPTKTPEYLAGGKPVISASIRDVVNPYGVEGLVHIADDAETFIKCAEKEFATTQRTAWLAKTDAFLEHNSWDKAWARMVAHINQALPTQLILTVKQKDIHV